MYLAWNKVQQRIMYCISTVNTQHIQRPNVLVQLGYIWRHVSAVILMHMVFVYFVY